MSNQVALAHVIDLQPSPGPYSPNKECGCCLDGTQKEKYMYVVYNQVALTHMVLKNNNKYSTAQWPLFSWSVFTICFEIAV